MNFLDGLGKMFGGQQQPMQMENPYQAQAALQNAQMQKQRAMQMQDPQYQGGGAVGILAGLAQILRGRSIDKKADETITQALGRMTEFDTKARQSEAERQAAEDEKRWQRELAKIQKTEEAKAQYRQQKEPSFEQQLFQSLPENMRGQAALGKFGLLQKEQAPRAPSELETRIQLAREMGIPDDQIKALVMGSAGAGAKASPEEREGAKLRAGQIKDAEERARAPAKTLENVTRLQELMDKGLSTGPMDQFLPGGDRQLFDSLASDLNLSTLRQNFGGNPTEGERAANAATLPGKAQYEDVNTELLKKLRANAEAKLKEAMELGIDVQAFSPAMSQQKPAQFTGYKITRID